MLVMGRRSMKVNVEQSKWEGSKALPSRPGGASRSNMAGAGMR
jgi:hypothetical protein